MEQGHYRLSCQTSLCNAPACPAKQKSMSDTVFFRKTLCAWPHSNRPTLCFWIFMIRSISHGFLRPWIIPKHYVTLRIMVEGLQPALTEPQPAFSPKLKYCTYFILFFDFWFFLYGEPCSVPFCPLHLTHSSQLLASLYFLQHATVGISQSVGQCVTQVPT